jgi:preprotein translocase subunit SecE
MSSIDQVKSAPVRATAGIRGWWDNSRNFLTEVRNEMKRVTWPSRREVYATTLVVILTSAFFGIYLWTLDLALTWVMNWIFRRFGVA